jgi:hypothetical protein
MPGVRPSTGHAAPAASTSDHQDDVAAREALDVGLNLCQLSLKRFLPAYLEQEEESRRAQWGQPQGTAQVQACAVLYCIWSCQAACEERVFGARLMAQPLERHLCAATPYG